MSDDLKMNAAMAPPNGPQRPAHQHRVCERRARGSGVLMASFEMVSRPEETCEQFAKRMRDTWQWQRSETMSEPEETSTARIRCRLTRPYAEVPTYATAGASGMDGYAAAFIANGHADCYRGEPLTLNPGARALIMLGIACEIPPGLELQVRPRSGLALTHGVVAMFGTIDSDYRGEIGATLVNLGSEPATIAIGDRVCQLVLAPVVRAEMVLAEELGQSERGAGGFGSTGR